MQQRLLVTVAALLLLGMGTATGPGLANDEQEELSQWLRRSISHPALELSACATVAECAAAVDEMTRASAQLIDVAASHNSSSMGSPLTVASPLKHWPVAFTGAPPDTALAVNVRRAQAWRALFPDLSRVITPTVPQALGVRRRLRVGYLSGSVCAGAIGKLLLGLLLGQDSEEFDRTVIKPPGGCNPKPKDMVAQFLRQLPERFVELPGNLDAASQLLADLELDVLAFMEISPDSFSYFLSFARVARVQVLLWGHPLSPAVPHSIDYFVIPDGGLFPDDLGEVFAEQLVRLSTLGTFLLAPLTAADGSMLQARSDLSFLRPLAHARLFGCMHHCNKFHPLFLGAVTELLHQDPGGFLLVRVTCVDTLRARLPSALGRRVLGMPFPLTENQFVKLLSACDVNLEPFPFPASITTLDSFATGTPVVALASSHNLTFTVPRLSAMLYGLLATGHYDHDRWLDAVLADSPSAFVAKALALARDPSLRNRTSKKIVARRGALFENPAASTEWNQWLKSAVGASSD